MRSFTFFTLDERHITQRAYPVNDSMHTLITWHGLTLQKTTLPCSNKGNETLPSNQSSPTIWRLNNST